MSTSTALSTGAIHRQMHALRGRRQLLQVARFTGIDIALQEKRNGMTTIYEYTSQPRYWVVHDDDGYWLVPARDGGWHEREPFVGHAIALREVVDPGGVDLGMQEKRKDG